MISIQYLILGIVASFIGSLPIGMLNLTAIDISVNKGIKSLISFSAAASIIEFFYAFIAIVMTEWIMRNDHLNYYINVAIIPVFIILAINYFYRDNLIRKNKKLPRQQSPFMKGVLLSLINPLCIPFWIFYTSYFHSFGWIDLSTNYYISILVLGISVGTFLALIAFGITGQILVTRIQHLNKWLNRIIGFTLILLAIIQAIRLFFN